MASDQKLNWGSIKWIYEPEEGSGSSMRIGISTMNPHTEQPPHVHYGDEQFLYVISGHGKQWIDDEEMALEPGVYCHIPTGIVHRQTNHSEEPLVKILASIPALYTAKIKPAERKTNTGLNEAAVNNDPHAKSFVYDAGIFSSTVCELMLGELSDLRVPLTIFDAERRRVYRSREFPEFCCRTCRVEEDTDNCEFLSLVKDSDDMANAYVCKYGIWVYTFPVQTEEGDLLGYIKAGHVRTRAGDSSAGYGAVSPNQVTEAVYSVPDSTISGIIETVRRVARLIVGYYKISAYQTGLRQSEQELDARQGENLVLRSTLKDARTQAFNLQLNQHFLFNTLNALAGMAVEENAFGTYDGICDLADLLRYTLRTSDRLVDLAEEMRYVRNYTNLQKMRFGDRLRVYYDVPEGLNGLKVPFNFLQPVVENCFNHGFRNRKTGQSADSMDILVAVSAGTETEGAGRVKFTVADNGEGMDAEELAAFRRKIAERTDSHGTLMVIQKLASLYADDFTYEADSDGKGKGCKITITIPV